MSRTVSLTTFRKIVAVALFALGFIIVSGGAVRLTGSGLGCPDWPTCSKDSLVAPLSYHPMIEFVNRMVTGLVSIAVIAAMVSSLFLKPRRKDLIWLSFGLVAGVIAQIVWGGLTVLFELAPTFVAGHFIISIFLLTDAVVLYERVKEAEQGSAPAVYGDATQELFIVSRLMIVALGLVTLLGTVLTGSGPHGGDERAKRFNFVVGDVARVHGIAVMIFLGLLLYSMYMIKNGDGSREHMRRATFILTAALIQACIGYVQYFTGVPAFLVGLHLLGATVTWVFTLQYALSVSRESTFIPKNKEVPA